MTMKPIGFLSGGVTTITPCDPPNQIVIDFPLAGLNRVQIKLCVPISKDDFERLQRLIELVGPSIIAPVPAAELVLDVNHGDTEGTKGG